MPNLSQTGPDLPTLFRLFDPNASPPPHEVVGVNAVPYPYHKLLVHTEHMTVTVEDFYHDRVAVQVLESRHEGDYYSRKILLSLEGTRQVVQFGIIRIRLPLCTPAVRDQILAEGTPLGRVLIEHNVMRRIELTNFQRMDSCQETVNWFSTTGETFGRLGFIFCDGQPAIELLEILAPIHAL